MLHEQVIQDALQEDAGLLGDITTLATCVFGVRDGSGLLAWICVQNHAYAGTQAAGTFSAHLWARML